MSTVNYLRPSEKAFTGALVLGLILLGIVAYSNTFSNGFVWDDASSVQINKHIQDPSFFFQLFKEQQHPFKMQDGGNFYRPLVAASFMLDYVLAGGMDSNGEIATWSFHLTNMLLHIAAAVLLLLLMTRLGAPRLVRCLAPMVYVVHPLHTEAVAYISGRADMMSAVFMFAGLWFAIWDETFRRRIWGTTLSALCFAAALMSKESSLIFPVLLAVLVVARPVAASERRNQVYMARSIPLGVSIAILAVYGVLRMTVLHFGSAPAVDNSLGSRLVEMCQALALYAGLLFVPVHLHMERTLTDATLWTAITGAALFVVIIGALIALGLHRGRAFEPRWRIALGLGWFVVTWLPISGIFPLNAPMAEHWMYVPLAGLLWAMAEVAAFLVRGRNGQVALGGLVCAMSVYFVVLTVDRNRDWHDNETLFVATLAENPNSARVHQNLAITYDDILGNRPGARRHYERVLEINANQKRAAAAPGSELPVWPQELDVHRALGEIYLRDKQYGVAASHFAKMANVKPANDKQKALVCAGIVGLGKSLLGMGNRAKAWEVFEHGVSMYPEMQHDIVDFLATAT